MVFELAAGLQNAVDVLIQLLPVADGPVEIPDVDEVKCVIGPGEVLVCIVDLEGQVRRCSGWLDRGNVRSCNMGVSELVGEVAVVVEILISPISKQAHYLGSSRELI